MKWIFDGLELKDIKSTAAKNIREMFFNFFNSSRESEYDSPGNLEIEKVNKNTLVLTYAAEYGAPELNFKLLKEISNFFGTDKIHVDEISEQGCETCDWGSLYGHKIIVKNPTKNIP